tara:strand:- start:41174 stop:43213 length:2040 start_codon:yes stop_codon:yes gene_type:complete
MGEGRFPGLNIGKGNGLENLNIKNILGGKATDPFRTGGNGAAGDALLEMQEVDLQKDETARIPNTQEETVKAAPSRFNPFNVFRFRKFGLAQGAYDLKKHSDTHLYGASEGLTAPKDQNVFSQAFNYISNVPISKEDDLKDFNVGEYQKTQRNPTAAQIIENFRDDSNFKVLGPTPFAYNDFIFCTHYGKIPNNRLIALRRYPGPVEDSLRQFNAAAEEVVNVPLAQALTYYGTGTGNDINNVLPISWDVPWEKKTAEVNEIDGNEILVDDVIAAAGIEKGDKQALIRAAIASQKGNQGALEVAGYDKELQDYIRKAYGPDGPYWNRVLGPVNVVNSTRMRKRGMGTTMFDAPIKLKFSYTLRSFNFVNPRVAFLDLMTNILSLTYNTAPFWGGGYRYFKNPGVTISSAGSALIEQGKIVEGVILTLNEWMKSASGATAQLLNQVSDALEKTTGGKPPTRKETPLKYRKADGKTLTQTGMDLTNAVMAGRAESLMQAPLSYRSLLEGRPVGEWHMTVGNPMDPMAAMGNLICTACDMKFSNELGADDFPKSVDFTVTLTHGRPRAKQDIESIFNLGGGPLSFSKVVAPSSTKNTFGGEPSNLTNMEGAEGNVKVGVIRGSGGANTGVSEYNLQEKEAEYKADPLKGDDSNPYAGRVGNHYGSIFGNSSLLKDYIKMSAT